MSFGITPRTIVGNCATILGLAIAAFSVIYFVMAPELCAPPGTSWPTYLLLNSASWVALGGAGVVLRLAKKLPRPLSLLCLIISIMGTLFWMWMWGYVYIYERPIPFDNLRVRPDILHTVPWIVLLVVAFNNRLAGRRSGPAITPEDMASCHEEPLTGRGSQAGHSPRAPRRRTIAMIVAFGVPILLVVVSLLFWTRYCRERERDARIKIEMAELAHALERYKEQFGEYPANLDDPVQVRRHCAVAWPRANWDSWATRPPTGDAAQSLLFWLGSFNKNPLDPFKPGGDRTFALFAFDTNRLRDGRYYPPGSEKPYVYFNKRCSTSSAQKSLARGWQAQEDRNGFVIGIAGDRPSTLD